MGKSSVGQLNASMIENVWQIGVKVAHSLRMEQRKLLNMFYQVQEEDEGTSWEIQRAYPDASSTQTGEQLNTL